MEIDEDEVLHTNIPSGMTLLDGKEIWHVLTHDGLYLQRVDDVFDWVDTDEPGYFLTANNGLMINMMLENHSFSQAYIRKYPEEEWDGILTSMEIALMAALCHSVSLDGLELVRLDGERYPMRLTEEVKQLLHLLYEVLDKQLSKLQQYIEDMKITLDKDDDL